MKDLYNIKICGVDVFDQYLEMGSIQRATKKWYKKLLYFVIEAGLINSKYICDKRFRKENIIQFKERIIKYIFYQYNKIKEIEVNEI